MYSPLLNSTKGIPFKPFDSASPLSMVDVPTSDPRQILPVFFQSLVKWCGGILPSLEITFQNLEKAYTGLAHLTPSLEDVSAVVLSSDTLISLCNALNTASSGLSIPSQAQFRVLVCDLLVFSCLIPFLLAPAPSTSISIAPSL